MTILKELTNKYSKEDIETLYNKIKSVKGVAKEINCSITTTHRLFDLYNLKKIYNVGNKKHYINERYFEIIDSEDKAYWLGFIMADGCVYKGTGNTYRLQINLKASDKGHLNLFAKNIKSDYNVSTKETNNSFVSSIKINSTKLCKDLIKHGVTERKSLTCSMPNLNKSLVRHFIRGYFDGDGWITLNISERIRKEFGICSGSIEMINNLNTYLNINYYKKRNNNLHKIVTSDTEKIKKIYKYLYENCTICLQRKKRIFDILIYMLDCPLIK